MVAQYSFFLFALSDYLYCPKKVHWGEKLLSDLTGQATVDRLPVSISGVGTQELFSIPKLNLSTDAEQDNIQVLRQRGSHRD